MAIHHPSGDVTMTTRKTSPVQVIHDIRVLVFPHDQNLIDDQLFLGLLLKVHLFDGHLRETTYITQALVPLVFFNPSFHQSERVCLESFCLCE